MWTTKQANNAALAVDLTMTVVIVVLAVRAVIDGFWLGAAGFAAMVGYLAYRAATRHRRGADMLEGRAGDEREAYIQLRTWATIGQASVLAVLALLAIDVARGEYGNWYLALLGFGAVHFASVTWLKARA